jgi:prophage tail gpP-like protein
MSDITSIPTPGKKYKVKKGDWISRMANTAYGDGSKWRKIKAANISKVRSAPDSTGTIQEFFKIGEIVEIPELEERKKKDKRQKQLPEKKPEDFTLIIGSREIPTSSIRAVRTMDTGADGWSASFAWTPGLDKELDKITAPLSSSKSAVYIGGELIIDGKLYDVEHGSSNSGRLKNLWGFSIIADMVDSSVQAPYERNNITLVQRAESLAAPHGLSVIVADGVDPGGQFKRITAEKQDKEFDHLAGLARQRGVLISNTIHSDVFITQANTKGEPVGTIEEKFPPAQEYLIKFSGRDRYNSYKALSSTPRKSSSVVVKDNNIAGFRNLTFTAPESTSGELTAAALWQRNKTIADALTLPFPVEGWYNPLGNLWEPNTLVTIVSATIGTEKGFTFLIRSVEYILDGSGRTAVLNIIPPQVYTKEDVDEPWIVT